VRLLFSRVSQQVDAEAPGAAPGTVLGLRDDALRVAAARGVVELLELQRAGRRPVAAREFLNAERRDADAAPLVFT
jgi:methionyl-tRNA formyltransferase